MIIGHDLLSVDVFLNNAALFNKLCDVQYSEDAIFCFPHY